MKPFFQWAVVTDNADPDGLQRVKIAAEDEDESMSEWIPIITPYGSTDMGLSFLPEVGDEVLIVPVEALSREKNDNAVLGTAWVNDIPPPETGENTDADLNKNGENALRFFKSRAGHQLIFDDTDGKEKIQILSADDSSRLEFDSKEAMVMLDTKNDIHMGAKGSIIIQAEEEIAITSKKKVNISTDDCLMAAKKGLAVKTNKEMGIKGSGISLN